jgi:hypothetical protein
MIWQDDVLVHNTKETTKRNDPLGGTLVPTETVIVVPTETPVPPTETPVVSDTETPVPTETVP